MTGFRDYDKYDGLGLAELVRKKEGHKRDITARKDYNSTDSEHGHDL